MPRSRTDWGLGRQLRAAELPINRLAVHLRTLHPEILGRTVAWLPNEPVEVQDRQHGLEVRAEFVGSPIRHVMETLEHLVVARSWHSPPSQKDDPKRTQPQPGKAETVREGLAVKLPADLRPASASLNARGGSGISRSPHDCLALYQVNRFGSELVAHTNARVEGICLVAAKQNAART